MIVFGIFKRNGSVYTEIVRTDANARCKLLFAVASSRKQSFTRTAGAAMTDWLMSDTKNLFALIIQIISLPMARIILMALRASGRVPSDGFKNSTECRNILPLTVLAR